MKNFTKLALVLGMTTASILSQTGTASARDGNDIFANFEKSYTKLSSKPEQEDKQKDDGKKRKPKKGDGKKDVKSSADEADLFSSFVLPTFEAKAPSKSSSKVSSKKAEQERAKSAKEIKTLKKQLATQEAELDKAQADLTKAKLISDKLSALSTVYNTDVYSAVQLLADLMNTHSAGTGANFFQGLGALLREKGVDISKPTAIDPKDSKMNGVMDSYAQAKKGVVEQSEMFGGDDDEGESTSHHSTSSSSSEDEDVDGKKGGADATGSSESNDDSSSEEELVRNDKLIAAVAKISNEDGFQIPAEAYKKYLDYYKSLGLKTLDGLDEDTANAVRKLQAVLKRGPKKADGAE